MLIIETPAKLNLTLEVLGKRQDGFHEIRSVIQTVSLFDRISFQLSQNVEFKCDLPNWSSGKSLVLRSVNLLQEATECAKGVKIEINKRIPLVSGLGGDSSDAAATLRGLNRLWELNLPQEKLLDLASQLGSDVTFFLHGGTALLEGRGEIVTPLPSLPHRGVILVVPPMPRPTNKTEKLYASLKSNHFTDGKITERLIKELKGAGEFTPHFLFNTFENVAFDRFSELSTYREHILKIGATNIHLAGSGPSLFTLVEDENEAGELYVRLLEQGLESYFVDILAGAGKIEDKPDIAEDGKGGM